MKFIQEFEDVVNIPAIDMFTASLRDVILEKLRRSYEGRCKGNNFILKILDIVNKSDCRMAKDRLDGSGDVDVRYKAEVLHYFDGETITGCRIKTVTKMRIICEIPHAIVTMRQQEYTLHSLHEGQMLTVVVERSIYAERSQHINVITAPANFQRMAALYPLTMEIPREHLNVLTRKLDEWRAEKDLLEQAGQRNVQFFRNVYYPNIKDYETFRKQIKTEKDFRLVDITELALQLVKTPTTSKMPLFLFDHRGLDLSYPAFLEWLAKPEDLQTGKAGSLFEPGMHVEEPKNAAAVLSSLLQVHISYIRMLREMSEIYATEKDREAHSNIWNSYEKFKK